MIEEFTGKEYVQIDISNQMGFDKLTWRERIDWAEDNESRLESLDEQAKAPVLYRKAVRAFRKGQAGRPTGFIMGLDATSSFGQILGALSGCESSLTRTNCIDTGRRENYYQYVADKMSVQTDIQLNAEVVKKPVMTTFYGSKRQPQDIFGKDTLEIKAFYDVLLTSMPGPMFLMAVMQGSWNPRALVHGWIMPDGHVVRIPVMRKMDMKIPLPGMGEFTFRTDINAPMRKGLSQAANITHSVDGYIVREMVRRGKKRKIKIATIHDSFWSTPNHMNEVRALYREILAEIADADLFKFIIEQILGDSTNFSKINPNLGNKILESNYALS